MRRQDSKEGEGSRDKVCQWPQQAKHKIDKQIAKLAHRLPKTDKRTNNQKRPDCGKQICWVSLLFVLLLAAAAGQGNSSIRNKAIHSRSVIHTAAQSCELPWPFISHLKRATRRCLLPPSLACCSQDKWRTDYDQFVAGAAMASHCHAHSTGGRRLLMTN